MIYHLDSFLPGDTDIYEYKASLIFFNGMYSISHYLNQCRLIIMGFLTTWTNAHQKFFSNMNVFIQENAAEIHVWCCSQCEMIKGVVYQSEFNELCMILGRNRLGKNKRCYHFLNLTFVNTQCLHFTLEFPAPFFKKKSNTCSLAGRSIFTFLWFKAKWPSSPNVTMLFAV